MYPKRRYFLDHPLPFQDLKAGPWQREITEKMVKRLATWTKKRLAVVRGSLLTKMILNKFI